MEEVEALIVELTSKKNVIHLKAEDLLYLRDVDEILVGEYTAYSNGEKGRTQNAISQFFEDSKQSLIEYPSCIFVIETSEKGSLMMDEMEDFHKVTGHLNDNAKMLWSYAIKPELADDACKLTVILSK